MAEILILSLPFKSFRSTDCISPAWRRKLIHPVLDLWGSHGLITILQLLPERLWERTALASEIPVQLHSLNPGTFNSQLIVETATADECGYTQIEKTNISFHQHRSAVQNSISIPVVTLEPHSLLTWSRVIAGLGNVSRPKSFLEDLPALYLSEATPSAEIL